MKKIWVLTLPLSIMLLSGMGWRYKSDHAGLKFFGTLEMTEYSLGARVAGKLTSVTVREGDQVEAGEVMATLDRFEQNQKDYLRTQKLFQKGGTTEQEVERAGLNVEDQRIISPVKGVVLIKVHELGEIVAAGAPVVVIGDRSDLWVKIYIPEGLINKMKLKQSAILHFDGLNESFSGFVNFIAPLAEFTPRNVQTAEERITQTFAVKIKIENPPDYLRPGVAADVTIDIQE